MYFMATRGTVKLFSRGSGEDLGNVTRGRRPRATVTQIVFTTEGHDQILGMRATEYSYFMDTRGTVKLLSRGSVEDLGNCCQRPKAEGISFPDLLHYRGTMV